MVVGLGGIIGGLKSGSTVFVPVVESVESPDPVGVVGKASKGASIVKVK